MDRTSIFMASGGARILAGRRPKPKTRRVKAPTDAEKITGKRQPHGAKLPKQKPQLATGAKTQKQLEKIYLTAKDRHLEMPLDFLLRVMRDPLTDEPVAMQAAIAAAPYCHPKFSTIVFKKDAGEPGDDARDMTDVIDFFTSRISNAGSRAVPAIIDVAPSETGTAEVPVARVVGAE